MHNISSSEMELITDPWAGALIEAVHWPAASTACSFHTMTYSNQLDGARGMQCTSSWRK